MLGDRSLYCQRVENRLRVLTMGCASLMRARDCCWQTRVQKGTDTRVSIVY